MNGKQANVIVRRAIRAGMTKPQIAVRIGCSTPTLDKWRVNASQVVGQAFVTNLRGLRGELDALTPKGTERKNTQ